MDWTEIRWGVAAVAGVAVLACGPKITVGGEQGGTTGGTDPTTQGPTEPTTGIPTATAPTDSTGAGSDTGDPSTTGADPTGPMPTEHQADILFVIDNSGSMGEEQQLLGAEMSSLVNVLDAAGVDYRIAVTTTDSGNPWCNTSPEAGNMVASSCRSRLPDFIFQGATEVDATEACTLNCPEEWASIELLPSTVAEDPTPRVRPWIEAGPNGTNLEGLDATTALGCMLPQGINGCGFEQQLESMYKAMLRTTNDAEDELGFHREGALLSVIFITDEADCSYASQYDSIFLPGGEKTFWSDPVNQQSPTSAVCWNAGVQCIGDPGGYDSCSAAYYDELGTPVDPDAAVMLPVDRYVGVLESLQDVHAYAIFGVPEGYPEVPITYQDAPGGTPNDPNFQVNFGIGPGCVSQTAEAVPPVRIREMLEALPPEEGDMFSICAAGYGPSLSSIATSIVDALQ